MVPPGPVALQTRPSWTYNVEPGGIRPGAGMWLGPLEGGTELKQRHKIVVYVASRSSCNMITLANFNIKFCTINESRFQHATSYY